MTDSILDSTKKVLGIDASYTAFDVDITMHINSVFSTLQQLGIGPESGFEIQDSSSLWVDYLGTDKNLNSVKTYVFLKVRLLFDPPATSYAQESLKNQIEEFGWRLNVYREGLKYPTLIGDDFVTAKQLDEFSAKLVSKYMTVVEAGTNLSAPRPAGATAVYWKFSAGVDVGNNGSNIVNAQPGDTFHVATT